MMLYVIALQVFVESLRGHEERADLPLTQGSGLLK